MFIVKKRFPRFELRENEEFTNQQDAEKFIQKKLQEDIQLKISATYLLCEYEEIIKEFTQRDVVPTASSSAASSSESSSQQQSSKQIFNPSPLPTTLRPAGMPQNWKTEKDDKKE